MKTIRSIALCTALTLTLSASALGQTIPTAPPVPTGAPPSSPQTFVASFATYFGAHNPALAGAFTDRKGEVWTGADYQNQINVSSSIGLEYNAFNFNKGGTNGTAHYLALESVTRNAGIAGTIVSEQLDAKFKVVIQGDLEIGFFAGGGYTLNPNRRALIAVGADLKKALTENTWGGLRIEDQFQRGGKSKPVISVIVGINF